MGKRSPKSAAEIDAELSEDAEQGAVEEEGTGTPEGEVDEKALIVVERQLLEAKITAEFDPEFVKVLRRIAYYLSQVGLTLKEACQLVQMPLEQFEAKMQNYPIIAELIAFKELEYKADLLSTISSKARQGNDKLATWLLESRYPDEFNQRKGAGKGDGSGDDLIAAGVEFVQKHGDAAPLVGQSSGKAFIVAKKGSGGKDLMQRLSDLMRTDHAV